MRRRLPFAVLLVVLRTTAGMPSLASPLMTFDDGCIALNNCSGRGLCRDGAAIAKPSELPGSAVNYGMAVCLCESHWRGDDCSVRTCVNDCSGRGVCAAVGGGLRLCQCDAGFGGEDCSTRMCPGGCSGHGRCIADNFTCACDAGWTGSSCAEVECSPLADCSGRGTCSGGECLCQGGWEGAACERAACPMSCSGHGLCGEDGVCQCRPGFGGVDCSALACLNDCRWPKPKPHPHPRPRSQNPLPPIPSGYSPTALRLRQRAWALPRLRHPAALLPLRQRLRGARLRRTHVCRAGLWGARRVRQRELLLRGGLGRPRVRRAALPRTGRRHVLGPW